MAESPAGERLQKVLAAAGVASRRSAERLIASGRVRVNGQVVPLGTRIDPASDRITVDGRPLARGPSLSYWLLHKPVGVISTVRDPQGRRTVVDHLPPGLGRLFPVGRLDADSEGLILLTNDGRLTHALLHPRHEVDKEYRVTVAGAMSDATLARLRGGIALADGMTRPARVRLERRTARTTRFSIVLREGRNRQIRRMCEAVGHRVLRLCRTRIGPIRLGGLPPGGIRSLTAREVAALYRAAGLGQGVRPFGEERR